MNESKSYSINYDPGKEYMIGRPEEGQWTCSVLEQVGGDEVSDFAKDTNVPTKYVESF